MWATKSTRLAATQAHTTQCVVARHATARLQAGKRGFSRITTPNVVMRPVYYLSSLLHKTLRSLGPKSPQLVKVKDILQSRQADKVGVFVVDQEQSAFDALKKMVSSKTYCVAVTQKSDPSRIVGLLTAADYLRRVVTQELDESTLKVKSVMTPIEQTAYVMLENSVQSCARMMAEGELYHLAVLDEQQHLLAVVNMAEVLKVSQEVTSKPAGLNMVGDLLVKLKHKTSISHAQKS